ncbi:MAG: YqeG family HAD IIIA-type phosphatase [Clostridia bacterium]|nr:YqeG family HAD IIIA-type phosphatase [Clostridia bacterium]
MKNLFYPDDYKPHFYDYDAAYLTSRGIRYLSCDIDNTLVTYDDPEPTDAVLSWLETLGKAGITVAFLSNNDSARVERFNAALGYYAEADAHKPLPGAVKRFLVSVGKISDRRQCAHLGDQVFTDVLTARIAGVTPLLVPPIKDKLTLFFRIKRAMEKPIVARYAKKYGKQF